MEGKKEEGKIEEERKEEGKKKAKKKKREIKKWSLFDQNLQDILSGIKPAPSLTGSNSPEKTEKVARKAVLPDDPVEDTTDKVTKLSVSTSKSCSVCDVEFDTHLEQREHFKLDWHRFNIKLKMEGRSPLAEDKFEAYLQDNDDVLSLSGSEDEEDDEDDGHALERHRHPSTFFVNDNDQLLSVHKCALLNAKDEEVTETDIIQRVPNVRKNCGKWAIFMLGGGHFAGAVFNHKDAILHKTFHCYTVRAKQGGSQSAADNRSGSSHPKSAGASLRRYNEAALTQHVREIVSTWGKELNECGLIFVRAAGVGNKSVLFGGKEAPLDKADKRLRSIPFATRRATFSEVKRVHEMLSSVEMHGTVEEYLKRIKTKRGKTKGKANRNIRRSKSRETSVRHLPEIVQNLAESSSESESESDVEYGFETVEVSTSHLEEFGFDFGKNNSKKEQENQLQNNLVTACKSGNVKLLKDCLDELETLEDPIELKSFINSQFGQAKLTPLHIATKAGHRGVVKVLLTSGADPSIKDKEKKVPYNLCGDKEMRNVYITFQKDNPDTLDMQTCQIPAPLSEEAEAKRKEKKKAQRDKKKEKEKVKKEIEKEKAKEVNEKQRFLALSDREKRALAAERRLLDRVKETGESQPVLLRCFLCANDITGKVPFEYEVYKFCSVKCVQNHRKKGSK